MTDTNGKNINLIKPDTEEIFRTQNYAGFGDNQPILFGPECEFFICKIQDGTLKPINNDEADRFMASFTQETGGILHQEAIASHFELNYGPMDLSDFREKIMNYYEEIASLYRFADEQGYRVIPSSHAPHIEGIEDVIDQLTHRDRIQTVISTGRKILGDHLVTFANLTAGIHVSAGYRNTEEFGEDLFMDYCLSPFEYVLSDNGFPYYNGLKEPTGSIVPRMAAVEIFANDEKGRTGIDPTFYETTNGEKFIKRYLGRTIREDQLIAFREKTLSEREINEGAAEPGLRSVFELSANPMYFVDLEKRGLNTVANLQMTASTRWYGVKIQDIPGLEDESGIPLKRKENRIWNAGTWQVATAVLTKALVRSEPDCGREVRALLEEFGFYNDGDALSAQSKNYLHEATDIAWKQGGSRGLAISFGKGTMQEFGQKYTAIMKKYATKHGLQDYLKPMEYITQTNLTDGIILRQICQTPEDVVHFIETYNVNVLPTPFACYGMLKDQGLLPNPAEEKQRAADSPPPAFTATQHNL